MTETFIMDTLPNDQQQEDSENSQQLEETVEHRDQLTTTGEDNGKCKKNCNTETQCGLFRKCMNGIIKARTRSDKSNMKRDLTQFLTSENICLVMKPCYNSNQKTILRIILEEVPNGNEIIHEQLEGLREFDEENIPESIIVNIGNGKLFEKDKPGNQALILSELLSVWNRTESPSSDALGSLTKHPVMVSFILEKWEEVKYIFYVHLR